MHAFKSEYDGHDCYSLISREPEVVIPIIVTLTDWSLKSFGRVLCKKLWAKMMRVETQHNE